MRFPEYTKRLETIIALSACVACASTSEPLKPDASVAVTFNRTSLRSTDTLVMKVLGTNTSGETIQVPNQPCLASMDVRNERDEPVQLGAPIYCPLPLYPPKRLAPGDTWGDVIRVTHPAAGVYRIRGALQARTHFVFSDFTTVTIAP